MVSEDPFIFQLEFEPKGRGDAGKEPKENKCVKCGAEDNLTRHHVVPYFLRKMMNPENKDHRSDDIVPLCSSCHVDYERSSSQLKKSILNGLHTYKKEKDFNKKVRTAKAILNSISTGKIKAEYIDPEKMREVEEYSDKTEIYIPTTAEQILNAFEEKHLIRLWKFDFNRWMGQNVFQDL